MLITINHGGASAWAGEAFALREMPLWILLGSIESITTFVLAWLGTGTGRKGKHKWWKQSLAYTFPPRDFPLSHSFSEAPVSQGDAAEPSLATAVPMRTAKDGVLARRYEAVGESNENGGRRGCG